MRHHHRDSDMSAYLMNIDPEIDPDDLDRGLSRLKTQKAGMNALIKGLNRCVTRFTHGDLTAKQKQCADIVRQHFDEFQKQILEKNPASIPSGNFPNLIRAIGDLGVTPSDALLKALDRRLEELLPKFSASGLGLCLQGTAGIVDGHEPDTTTRATAQNMARKLYGRILDFGTQNAFNENQMKMITKGCQKLGWPVAFDERGHVIEGDKTITARNISLARSPQKPAQDTEEGVANYLRRIGPNTDPNELKQKLALLRTRDVGQKALLKSLNKGAQHFTGTGLSKDQTQCANLIRRNFSLFEKKILSQEDTSLTTNSVAHLLQSLGELQIAPSQDFLTYLDKAVETSLSEFRSPLLTMAVKGAILIIDRYKSHEQRGILAQSIAGKIYARILDFGLQNSFDDDEVKIITKHCQKRGWPIKFDQEGYVLVEGVKSRTELKKEEEIVEQYPLAKLFQEVAAQHDDSFRIVDIPEDEIIVAEYMQPDRRPVWVMITGGMSQTGYVEQPGIVGVFMNEQARHRLLEPEEKQRLLDLQTKFQETSSTSPKESSDVSVLEKAMAALHKTLSDLSGQPTGLYRLRCIDGQISYKNFGTNPSPS